MKTSNTQKKSRKWTLTPGDRGELIEAANDLVAVLAYKQVAAVIHSEGPTSPRSSS